MTLHCCEICPSLCRMCERCPVSCMLKLYTICVPSSSSHYSILPLQPRRLALFHIFMNLRIVSAQSQLASDDALTPDFSPSSPFTRLLTLERVIQIRLPYITRANQRVRLLRMTARKRNNVVTHSFLFFSFFFSISIQTQVKSKEQRTVNKTHKQKTISIKRQKFKPIIPILTHI